VPAEVVTEIGPEVALGGTKATSRVELALLTLAAVSLNLTVLVPGVEPKLEPLIVTAAPGAPLSGLKLEILGARAG
jgi:hypothetical protein